MENELVKHPFAFEDLEDNLERLYERCSRRLKMDASSAEHLRAWQKEARMRLDRLLSVECFSGTEEDAQLLEERDRGSYLQCIYRLQTEENTFMPTALLRPKKASKAPAVLLIPAHGAGMLSYLEHEDYPELTAALHRMQRRDWEAGWNEEEKKSGCGEVHTGSFARRLAEEGYLVLIPELRGLGLRRGRQMRGQEVEKAFSHTHQELGHVAIALGTTVAAMNRFDIQAALAFLHRQNGWDGRLFAGGHSGGGMMSLFLSALLPEIQGTFVSGYFYGYRDALMHLPENCTCNYVPGLWTWFDICDIAAMIAPKPLYIESGTKDHLNGPLGMQNVWPQTEETRRAYRVMGAGEKLWHHCYRGDHMAGLTDEDYLSFLRRYLPVSVSDANLQEKVLDRQNELCYFINK